MNRMTADQIIEVVTAYKNGAEIEVSDINFDNWRPVGVPLWAFGDYCYRVVTPKPKTKTVKFFGYVDSDDFLMLRDKDFPVPSDWKRVPNADCEYEVEE